METTRHRTSILGATGVLAATICGLAPSAGRCEEFRVETKLYAGDSNTPASRNTTLFSGGRVVDTASDSDETIVLDRAGGKVVLLDGKRRLAAEITTSYLLRFSQLLRDQLQRQAAAKDDPLLKFVLRPAFEKATGESELDITFSSPLLTYRLRTTKPVQQEAASVYRSFCDVFARLNALVRPGGLPPFARLEINDQLARQGVIPTSVRLTIAPQERFGNREVSLRTEHEVTWRLSDDDLATIAEANRQMGSFRRVDLDEYLRGR